MKTAFKVAALLVVVAALTFLALTAPNARFVLFFFAPIILPLLGEMAYEIFEEGR